MRVMHRGDVRGSLFIGLYIYQGQGRALTVNTPRPLCRLTGKCVRWYNTLRIADSIEYRERVDGCVGGSAFVCLGNCTTKTSFLSMAVTGLATRFHLVDGSCWALRQFGLQPDEGVDVLLNIEVPPDAVPRDQAFAVAVEMAGYLAVVLDICPKRQDDAHVKGE